MDSRIPPVLSTPGTPHGTSPGTELLYPLGTPVVPWGTPIWTPRYQGYPLLHHDQLWSHAIGVTWDGLYEEGKTHNLKSELICLIL